MPLSEARPQCFPPRQSPRNCQVSRGNTYIIDRIKDFVVASLRSCPPHRYSRQSYSYCPDPFCYLCTSVFSFSLRRNYLHLTRGLPTAPVLNYAAILRCDRPPGQVRARPSGTLTFCFLHEVNVLRGGTFL